MVKICIGYSSLAMETRNSIFKNALTSAHQAFPHIDEEKLAKDISSKIPSHFDAFGAKRSDVLKAGPPEKDNLRDRDLDNACHGFPLHLPGHVEPCRDDVKIECTEKDLRLRRYIRVYFITNLSSTMFSKRS